MKRWDTTLLYIFCGVRKNWTIPRPTRRRCDMVMLTLMMMWQMTRVSVSMFRYDAMELFRCRCFRQEWNGGMISGTFHDKHTKIWDQKVDDRHARISSKQWCSRTGLFWPEFFGRSFSQKTNHAYGFTRRNGSLSRFLIRMSGESCWASSNPTTASTPLRFGTQFKSQSSPTSHLQKEKRSLAAGMKQPSSLGNLVLV